MRTIGIQQNIPATRLNPEVKVKKSHYILGSSSLAQTSLKNQPFSEPTEALSSARHHDQHLEPSLENLWGKGVWRQHRDKVKVAID